MGLAIIAVTSGNPTKATFDVAKDLSCAVDVRPKSCKEIKANDPSATDGVYKITIGSSRVDVWCNMEKDNGGWTTLQRRFDGTENFDRDFTDYQSGFGNKDSEHWLGLDSVFELTKVGNWEARFDMESFDGIKKHAKYSNFKVGAAPTFKLTIAGYSGTTEGDNMKQANGAFFTTRGRPQAGATGCYGFRKGAWWFKMNRNSLSTCSYPNLNAIKYGVGQSQEGMFWYQFHGSASTKHLKASH